MLFVERSNRTEALLDGLAARCTSRMDRPLAPVVVVVQGRGMERWIAQALADRTGICAGVEFPFPRHLLERLFDRVESLFGDARAPEDPCWRIEELGWSVARQIEVNRDRPELAPLTRQLSGADRDWRLVQLGQRLALRFDDYVTYRPDWVARWLSDGPETPSVGLGPDEAWQAWLLRRVAEDLGPDHFAARAERFLARLRAPHVDDRLAASLERELPTGLEVFGVATLPPLHLSVLDGLARVVDVHLSVLSPCRHYWADLWAELRDETAPRGGAPAEVAASAGGGGAAALLAGLGRLGGDFQHALERGSDYVECEPDRFVDPLGESLAEATLLRRLQSRLLEWGADEAPDGERPIARDDRSLEIHLCHGPRRELETIRAALLEAFERDSTLAPEDVIVMAPEIDGLAPVIDAVFGVTGEEPGAIPYRIADRGTLGGSPVARTFVSLLRLLTGRFGRSELLEWLAHEPARAALGIEPDELERISDWAARAGVRFGLDATHRKALELEPLRGPTWAGGLDRGMLGHAVGASSEVFAGIAPEPLEAFSDPAVLGALGELLAVLTEAWDALSRPRPVADWSAWLVSLLGHTLAQRDEDAHEHARLRDVLQRLAQAAQRARFEHPIPFEAMRERFEEALTAAPPAQGFLAGGVTFCELVPLRAIPFRVVAILGLSDAQFPRRRASASFDLVAGHPRAGDRSPRSDDRYLFLEALLSARDRLILTVPARDPRDGRPQPPSVVVSELLDALDADFVPEAPAPGERLRQRLVVEHPLQSFSPRYFEAGGDPRLVGLDAKAFEAARVLARSTGADSKATSRRFLTELEPAADVDPAAAPRLELDDFVERLLRSTRRFARERLGLRLPRPEAAVGDFDSPALDGLRESQLGRALLAELRAGASAEAAGERLAVATTLPVGEPGRLAARRVRAEAERLARLAVARGGREGAVDHPFDLELEPVETLGRAWLSGRLRELSPTGLLRVDFARLGRFGELALWLDHLVLCALVDQGLDVEARSQLVARPEGGDEVARVVVFERVADARERLATLFAWAWSADRQPLPLFPRSSAELVKKKGRRGGPDAAWQAAHRVYYGDEGSDFLWPESEEDLSHARVWEGLSPLESDSDRRFHFDALTRAFFEPYLEARQVFAR